MSDRERIAQLEAIIRTLVAANDSPDGAIGEVRAALGVEAAETIHHVLVSRLDLT